MKRKTSLDSPVVTYLLLVVYIYVHVYVSDDNRLSARKDNSV